MSSDRAGPWAAAEAAVERVLVAEREATEACARAEEGAARRTEAARAGARRVDERAALRVGRLRRAFSARTEEVVAALGRPEDVETRTEIEAAEVARLEQAVEKVAALLTGGRDE